MTCVFKRFRQFVCFLVLFSSECLRVNTLLVIISNVLQFLSFRTTFTYFIKEQWLTWMLILPLEVRPTWMYMCTLFSGLIPGLKFSRFLLYRETKIQTNGDNRMANARWARVERVVKVRRTHGARGKRKERGRDIFSSTSLDTRVSSFALSLHSPRACLYTTLKR